MSEASTDVQRASLDLSDSIPSAKPGDHSNRFLIAAAVLLLTAIGFFWFPGHTTLQADTQIYLPMMERLWDPTLYNEDVMAIRPHLSFTLYDESAFLLRRITGAGFENVLMGQQLLYRAIGILGLYLIASSTGIGLWYSLLTAALVSLGATIGGPSVLTVEYEAVPRGFAMPFLLVSLGTAAHGRFNLAALCAAIGFGFHPPTIIAYCGLLLIVLLRQKEYRAIGILALAPLVLLLTIGAETGTTERTLLFGRIDPQLEQVQRLRASYNWITVWLGAWYLHYILLTGLLGVAYWRVREKLVPILRFIFIALPILGILSIPTSYILLEKVRWTFIPQFQPVRHILFITLFAVVLSCLAGIFAVLRRRYFEGVLFFLVPMAVAIQPNLIDLLTPFEQQPLLVKRLLLAVALALLATLAVAFGRMRPLIAMAALVPFAVIPTMGEVRNYAALHEPELDAVATWARESTPKDAVFYFSDLSRQLQPGVFRARGHRALYSDWKAGGQVNFHSEFSKVWWKRWESAQTANTLPEWGQLGIDYVVFSAAKAPTGETPVYSNRKYAVYSTQH